MFTFAKPLDEITEGDLQRLITDRIEENRQLEYKRELPSTSEGEKREFVRDVVSFANSAGGHIIFGVAAPKGIPTEFTPIADDKTDEATLRLENIIRTSVEPAIQGLKIRSVKLGTGRVLIIEIPRGLFGLHMIKNRGAFVVRTSAGKADLDVSEVRAAFVNAEAAAQRLSEFRADRTAEILNRDIPWSLSDGPILTIHLLPLVSFAGYSCAVDRIPEAARKLLYPIGKYHVIRQTFTFDGYANVISFGGNVQPVEAYSQIFRNGAVENVNAGRVFAQQDAEESQGLQNLEMLIMDCAARMLKIMDLLDIPGPYYLVIALLNARGVRVSAQHRPIVLRDPNARTINQNHLILPEVLLENTDISIERDMRNSFDTIWNAAGWERSLSYDKNGSFKDENWRKIFE
jgi:Schlafen, AlbA_2